MSLVDLDPTVARPGQVACACEAYALNDKTGSEETWRLAIGFAGAVVAQALAFAILPVAGGYIAPRADLAMAPCALIFLGAAGASLLASLLLDQFGRRAAFALGASLGMAGGLLAGWAILTRSFPALCIGAVWLGFAQGLSLFYRHAAASARAGGSRAAIHVLAGGGIAGLIVPGAIWLSQRMFGPFADASIMLLAGVASFVALPIVLALPHSIGDDQRRRIAKIGRPFVLAAVVGFGSWFVMARAMASASSTLIGCGVGAAAAGGFVAWHLVAMFAPAAVISLRPAAFPTTAVTTLGVAILLLSWIIPRNDAFVAETLLIAIGVGWALCQVGASRLLHDGSALPRFALALHDCLILTAALLGALSAAIK